MQDDNSISEENLLKGKQLTRDTALYLQSLSDEALAAWQSGRRDNSAKMLLAEREWVCRDRAESAKWQRFSALVGLLGVVVGGIVTLMCAILLR